MYRAFAVRSRLTSRPSGDTRLARYPVLPDLRHVLQAETGGDREGGPPRRSPGERVRVTHEPKEYSVTRVVLCQQATGEADSLRSFCDTGSGGGVKLLFQAGSALSRA